MLPVVLKELGNTCFNAIMSQTWVVVQGEVALGDCTLRADLVGPIALGQRQCTRADKRMDLTRVAGGAFALSTLYE